MKFKAKHKKAQKQGGTTNHEKERRRQAAFQGKGTEGYCPGPGNKPHLEGNKLPFSKNKMNKY